MKNVENLWITSSKIKTVENLPGRGFANRKKRIEAPMSSNEFRFCPPNEGKLLTARWKGKTDCGKDVFTPLRFKKCGKRDKKALPRLKKDVF
jgi:hypothetical protein